MGAQVNKIDYKISGERKEGRVVPILSCGDEMSMTHDMAVQSSQLKMS